MEYRRFGNTDFEVSPMGRGCVRMSGPDGGVDDDESIASCTPIYRAMTQTKSSGEVASTTRTPGIAPSKGPTTGTSSVTPATMPNKTAYFTPKSRSPRNTLAELRLEPYPDDR